MHPIHKLAQFSQSTISSHLCNVNISVVELWNGMDVNVRIAGTTKNSPIMIERQAEIILETRNLTIQQTRSFIPLNQSPNSLGTLEYNEDREVILNGAVE